MKNVLTGLTITILIALSIFAAAQFKNLSLQAIENIAQKPSITPTPLLTPTAVPTLASIPFSGVQKTFIYLYPSKFIPMSVKLDDTINPQNSVPKYPKNGWYIISTSKSLIENQYDYLSFKNDVSNFVLPKTGWIIASSDLKKFFDENLPKFGLNKKEIAQFKSYCLSELKPSAFYQISYTIPKDKLLVNPPLDTILRYSFYFTNLDSAAALSAPDIVTPKRGATTAVELSAAFQN